MRKYKGQTESEFFKNYTRIKDIVEKSDNDIERSISLSKTQANRITDEHKAINRAMAAKELSESFLKEGNVDTSNMCMEIFDVFFRRAYELGSVKTQDYREYQLSKLF
jgi:hypothetical protein